MVALLRDDRLAASWKKFRKIDVDLFRCILEHPFIAFLFQDAVTQFFQDSLEFQHVHGTIVLGGFLGFVVPENFVQVLHGNTMTVLERSR